MILLDTHILLWWENDPGKLPAEYRTRLDTTSEQIAISVISCWEIAMLVRKARLELSEPYPEWINNVIRESQLTVLDVNLDIVEQVYKLPNLFHGDPADRIIAATAISYGAKLATFDNKLLGYEFLDIFK